MNELKVQKPKFSTSMQTEQYQSIIKGALQDTQRVQRFTASIMSAVSANEALQLCEPKSILSCALLGESLELSPSPQLGQYYMIPFDVTVKDRNGKAVCELDGEGKELKGNNGNKIYKKIKKATFVMGYKGYLQLALRSGYYKKFNVVAVKKGELISYNPFEEKLKINPILDDTTREATETVGYYAMFRYQSGFQKTMYWSKEKMRQHALKYSKAIDYNTKQKKLSNFWVDDFENMAFKTLIRQIISKWGIMSIQMRSAYEQDDSIIDMDGTSQFIEGEYIDNAIDGANLEIGEIPVGQSSEPLDLDEF